MKERSYTKKGPGRMPYFRRTPLERLTRYQRWQRFKAPQETPQEAPGDAAPQHENEASNS